MLLLVNSFDFNQTVGGKTYMVCFLIGKTSVFVSYDGGNRLSKWMENRKRFFCAVEEIELIVGSLRENKSLVSVFGT